MEGDDDDDDDDDDETYYKVKKVKPEQALRVPGG